MCLCVSHIGQDTQFSILVTTFFFFLDINNSTVGGICIGGIKRHKCFIMFVSLCKYNLEGRQPKVTQIVVKLTGLTNAVNKTCLLTITSACSPVTEWKRSM